MLLVLPFSQVDYRLALALAKYLQYLGPYKQHELLLVCPANVSEHLEEMQKLIGDQFARVSTLIPKVHKDGWPVGPNSMFHSIAYHIASNVDCPCWYMFEPDNTPIKPSWLNTLASEYNRTARPFLGVIHPTYYRRQDGTFYQDGAHLTGSSIYPKNAPQFSRLFRTIPHANIPWDVYWQWEIIKYAGSTNLIHHEWRSFNWHRDKKSGEIVGERKGGTLPPDINTPLPLRPDAVVHHGCKDGTIMNIMRGFFTSRAKESEEQLSLT